MEAKTEHLTTSVQYISLRCQTALVLSESITIVVICKEARNVILCSYASYGFPDNMIPWTDLIYVTVNIIAKLHHGAMYVIKNSFLWVVLYYIWIRKTLYKYIAQPLGTIAQPLGTFVRCNEWHFLTQYTKCLKI